MLLVQPKFTIISNTANWVSIHYMLLVQPRFKPLSQISALVSIHYMLLVQMPIGLDNTQYQLFQYIICCWFNFCNTLNNLIHNYVSIHYMLLVQQRYLIWCNSLKWFQYIICCWFKIVHFQSHIFHTSFNTLYVVGSTISFRICKLPTSVSIHYMLLVQVTLKFKNMEA